ncbi:MAG: aminotransferase class I/II-fold pyridoxal phosphate-dependent enzyme [Deltaproteobacteria bacterium]|nr:aminotransferase class I/II-fold pyridoxal phosphate-dependent enzyme [Deltaproteobacteria bacterium]
MNPIAKDLNRIIAQGNPHLLEMLSEVGKNLFFPKGILSQSAEAKEKAYKLNATIGIATEQGRTMHFPSVMDAINGIQPEASLTYAPSFGIPALRKVWQDSLVKKNPSLADKKYSLPVVTCGITHAISMFAGIWADPGDIVVSPDMMWGNYNMILSVRKGVTISHFPIFSKDGGYNLSAFEKKLTLEAQRHAKIIVLLNFPHNPTGYTVSEEEGGRIAEILVETAKAGTNVIAVTDDSYFGLFYEDNALKESLFAQLCDRHSRLLAVNRGSISNASHLSQSIVLKSMQGDNYEAEKEEKFKILKNRAQRVKEVLADPKYKDAWDVYPFNSGYFMCIRLKSVEAEPLRLHLLAKYGVGLISMGKTDLRVAFSCLEENDIPELFNIILEGIEDLQSMNK